LYTLRGYPDSYYDATNTDLVNKQCRLYERYSCIRFLGFLGESSTFIINTALLGDLTIEFTLEGTNVLMAGCTVPDTYPIILAGGANIYSTNNASNNNQGNIAGTSNCLNSKDPNNHIAGDTIAISDTVKAAADSFNAKLRDLQNYMKLTWFYYWRYWCWYCW
jgi:hypothetical protein